MSQREGPDSEARSPIGLGTTVDAACRGGPYADLTPHAKGGLGEVLRAADTALHRTVAIKRLQDRLADDPVSQQRFLVEAEITARLEHPGVVPVYGVFQDERGRPCYAMRFIEGHTLAAAIKAFHAGPADPVGFRRLLQSFIQVCQTIAYANSRGVIHRDLKPGNVMLGKFGETLVVDWGLSKVVGRPDELRAVSPEATLQPVGSGSGDETALGSAVGTPAYMSPEQAAGRWDVIDVASDIYGLGAVLYTLLTARPPLEKGNWPEMQQKIQRGDYPQPRAVNKGVPPALEAICLKAMAVRPEARYPSASALAGDIEHWLADEPVTARREPLPARLARWGRRHKALAAAAAALLSTAVVALSTGTVLLTQANRRTQAERDRAERNFHEAQQQRDLARENFLTARRAVDTYLTQVSEEHLLNEPGQQPLRRKLLQSALEYYQAFLRQQRDDPQLRKELADAHRRLGSILSDLSESGSLDEAGKALQEAVRQFEQLRAQAPADLEIRAGLAGAYRTLAELHALTSLRFGEAETEARQVIALAGQLQRDQPGTPEFGALLGRGHDLLGITRARQGDFPGAEKALREGIAVLEKQTHDAPHHAEGWRLLAGTHGNLAYLYHYMGRPSAEQNAHRQSIVVTRRLVRDNPRDTVYRRDLGTRLNNLAGMENEAGRFGAADQACGEGLPMLLQLVDDNPTGYRSQNRLSEMYLVSAAVKLARGQLRLADADFRKAVDLAEGVRKKNPEEKDMQLSIARGLRGLGLVAWRRGDLQAALRSYSRAKAEWDAFLALENNAFTQRLFFSFRGEWLALEVDALRRTAAEQLGPQAALVAEWEKLAKDDPSPVNQAGLAASHAQLADWGAQAGDQAQALRSLDRALVLLKEATDRQPDDCIFRQTLARAHAVRARLLAKDHVTAAVQSARQAVDLVEKLAGDETAYLYDLACHRALLSSLLDPKNAEAERQAAAAVEALANAVARGDDNLHRLKTDAILAPLRPRTDFPKLLKMAEANAKNGVR